MSANEQNPPDINQPPSDDQPEPEKRRNWLRRIKLPTVETPRVEVPSVTIPLPTNKPVEFVESVHLPQLELRLFDQLDTVGADNYIRYGASGPRRYVSGRVESAVLTPDHVPVILEFARANKNALLKLEALSLQRTEHIPHQRTVWAATLPDSHMQIVWIWDFFRMLSCLQIRVDVPPAKEKPNGDWQKLHETFKKLNVQDTIILEVDSRSGRISQRYVLDALPHPIE